MSMENGVSASTTKAAHGAHGAHGYGKGPASTVGGFASVLSSLGAEDETLGKSEDAGFLNLHPTHLQATVPGAAEAAMEGDAQTVPGLDTLALTGAEGLNADADQADDGLGAVSETEDSAQAAAALAALGLDLTGASAQGNATGDATATRLALAAAAGAAPGPTPGAHALGDAQGAVTTSTVGLVGGRAAVAADRGDTKGLAKDTVSSTAMLASGKQSGSAALTTEAPGLQRQVGQRNLSARADAAKADAVRGAKGEDVAARLGWRSEAAAQATQAAMAAGGQQSALAQGELGGGRFGFGSGERGEEGARVTLHDFAAVGAASTGPVAGAGLDPATLANPANAAPDAGLTAEMDVAEQVSYWVGRGARNAEISVEGLAENPIHITIAMQGQEARVMFRAEQAETRQVLQDAMPHLRELLEREGLTLGDVSVGHSDPGWNGGSEASAHAREQAANRLRLGSLSAQRPGEEGAVHPQGAARGVPLPAGRTLDLFV